MVISRLVFSGHFDGPILVYNYAQVTAAQPAPPQPVAKLEGHTNVVTQVAPYRQGGAAAAQAAGGSGGSLAASSGGAAGMVGAAAAAAVAAAGGIGAGGLSGAVPAANQALFLVSCSVDWTVRVWDVAQKSCIFTWPPPNAVAELRSQPMRQQKQAGVYFHNSAVYSMCVIPRAAGRTEDCLAVCYIDGMIQVGPPGLSFQIRSFVSFLRLT